MIHHGIPDNVSEEYYQIGDTILGSFPKYRPPLDLFVLDEKVMQLLPYSRKGARLTGEQVEELAALCLEGNVFVARSDHHIYSKHIIKQLDLILVDKNLKEKEIVSICIEAMRQRVADFFEQPVKNQFEALNTDLKVVTEFIWQDKHRLKLFVRQLWAGPYSVVRHSTNCLFLGMWLMNETKGHELTRKTLDDAALGLLIHDVGMSKIPAFILTKTKPLTPDEKAKIPPHVMTSAAIIRKLDVVSDVVDQVILEHHERLDGSGYPQHKKDLGYFGKLAAVADSFSAMLQTRPYACAKELMTVARELGGERTLYDPTLSGALLGGMVKKLFGVVTAECPDTAPDHNS